MTEYVTSDTHFNHKNICGENGFVSTRKQFKDVEEMNNVIIERINSVMTNEDTLYHLGDIGFYKKPAATFDLLCRIKGQIQIVKGNHDSSKMLKYLKNNNFKLADGRDKFVIHEVGFVKKYNGVVYYFTHYPLGLGEFRKNMFSICGHIHEEKAKEANVLNVGVDSPELPEDLPFAQPIEMDLVIELAAMKREEWYAHLERLLGW